MPQLRYDGMTTAAGLRQDGWRHAHQAPEATRATRQDLLLLGAAPLVAWEVAAIAAAGGTKLIDCCKQC